MRAAVFASGGGSNFGALLARKAAGDLHIDFACVISNNSGAGALDRAKTAGIPTFHLPPTKCASEAEYCSKLFAILNDHAVDICILAGYMKKFPDALIAHYFGKIINIHPALLPAFGGKGHFGHHVHEAVIATGAKVSGITVHFVDNEYDHGPIILQQTIPVLDTDTAQSLADRVLKLEHQFFYVAIEALATGKLTISGRRVLWHD